MWFTNGMSLIAERGSTVLNGVPCDRGRFSKANSFSAGSPEGQALPLAHFLVPAVTFPEGEFLFTLLFTPLFQWVTSFSILFTFFLLTFYFLTYSSHF